MTKRLPIESESISVAAHELRASLTAICWLTDFLKKERLTKQGRGYLDDISACVDRLNAMADTLDRKAGGKRLLRR